MTAFWKGHSVARYVHSLAPLTPLSRSAVLRFAMLASLARSIHGLAHSLRLLPCGTVEILEYVFTLKISSTENAFSSSLETCPESPKSLMRDQNHQNNFQPSFNTKSVHLRFVVVVGTEENQYQIKFRILTTKTQQNKLFYLNFSLSKLYVMWLWVWMCADLPKQYRNGIRRFI